MLEENFQMPPLQTLISKTFQLAALRQVKEAAAKAYKNLLNEEDHTSKLFQCHNSNAPSVNITTITNTNNSHVPNQKCGNSHNHNHTEDRVTQLHSIPSFNYQSRLWCCTMLSQLGQVGLHFH